MLTPQVDLHILHSNESNKLHILDSYTHEKPLTTNFQQLWGLGLSSLAKSKGSGKARKEESRHGLHILSVNLSRNVACEGLLAAYQQWMHLELGIKIVMSNGSWYLHRICRRGLGHTATCQGGIRMKNRLKLLPLTSSLEVVTNDLICWEFALIHSIVGTESPANDGLVTATSATFSWVKTEKRSSRYGSFTMVFSTS